ncbi:ABC transporter substrate-binding protein [Ahrensia sp. R2A130]|uniref:ABC transporter substrate-binding protein n=1 Tax=Ahrensia sp. R2A130 TaxID=744979 RepID=UPI0001E0C366|nr:ABC transporter substrate-binding protein [Ahrensia sp. R2A130]EFL88776.1 branched chain amino acid ABC transporter periplasmic substrate-binding protein [Ahrensia sp. R2A130]
MTLKKAILGLAATAVLASGAATASFAADEHYIPNLSYRTGPFAGGGIPFANGFNDYFTMLNERDGGIGGIKVRVEECETGYNSQKGVECYEATKGNNPLVYTPLSTGITLALIPKTTEDKIPLLTMGYGLSAGGVGETFPYTFTYPTSYWNQMSSILQYIDSTAEGGIKGKKVGFLYLDAGYGREPIPVLEALSKQMGFEWVGFPVAGKDMQNQGSQWLNVRKERPDYMVMWGWGAMNATAVKEAIKIRFPLDKFIGNWWAGANADLDPVGAAGKGYKAANFSGVGTSFPVIADIQKHVVDAGKSQADADKVGDVLYNRGMYNAVIIAEAIRKAQEIHNTKTLTGEQMRDGLEQIDISEARLKELGLEGFTGPLKGSCKDHEGGGGVFIQQWDGDQFVKISDKIAPMLDVTRPLLEEAAAKYVSDKPDWKGQTCN